MMSRRLKQIRAYLNSADTVLSDRAKASEYDELISMVAALEAQLAAHLENEGDECPLCACEAQVEALRDLLHRARHDIGEFGYPDEYPLVAEIDALLEDTVD